MLTANTQIEQGVIAWETEKSQAPFYCPECGGLMLIKKGRLKVHHFAHVPPVNCDYSHGESAEHLAIKRDIYLALREHPQVSKLELERDLKSVRPDISCYINSAPVAIEVQRSNLNEEIIHRRFSEYTRMGISLLWVLTPPIPEHHQEFKIRGWQRFLAQLQYGHLFYYRDDGFFDCFRLKSISITRDEYILDDGETVGGGTYFYKSIKWASYCGKFHIAKDFTKHMRNTYHHIPGGLIWLPRAMSAYFGE